MDEKDNIKLRKPKVIIGAGKLFKEKPAVEIIAQPKADPKAAVKKLEENIKSGVKRTEIAWPGNRLSVVNKIKE